MCGIAGIANIRGEKGRFGRPVQQMADAMKHRGPDDEGFMFFNCESHHDFMAASGKDSPEDIKARYEPVGNFFQLHASLAFGHRRLSILDLSTRGHQPMMDHSQRFSIIFNGEIYNYREIGAELKDAGYVLDSQTDTEVVLYAYRAWGEECLKRFNGMFAFAIYDRDRQELFLARDRVGIKPLYYTFNGDHLIFASDIKTIIASGMYQPQVNLEGLWHNLSFNVAPRPMTCFKGVYALEQAHWMRVALESGRVDRQRYWDIPAENESLNLSEEDFMARLEHEIHKSVKYRLISDVEVGTFMSGGIDSTTISSIANQHQPGIKAFTLGFDKSISEFDELNEARENARMNNLNHVIDIANPNDALESIDDFITTSEEPYPSLHPGYLVSKLVSRHQVKVILNGLGPDEILGGYHYYKKIDLWRYAKNMQLALQLIPSRLAPEMNILKHIAKARSVDEYYSLITSIYYDDEKRKLFSDKNLDYQSQYVLRDMYLKNKSFKDPLRAMNYLDLMRYIGSHHLYRDDQNNMFFSLEGRYPFLDHNLIEFAFRVPSNLKVKNNTTKYLLRKLSEKYISPKSVRMKKKGFGLPVGRWMNHELSDYTQHSLNSLKKRDIFDPRAIDRMRRYTNDKYYQKVWHLVMVEQWFQKFMDGKDVS